ncbi:MAG: type 4a pilus biogenesis protein PilO [Candidatus Omnitrophota bacterium]
MNINFLLNKILKGQIRHRELILWLAGLLFFVLIFTQLLIAPTAWQIQQLKEEIVTVNERFKNVLQDQKSLETILVERQKELSALEENLPRQERLSSILTGLSKKATELGINVISVRPSPAIPYPSVENPFRMEGRTCEALLIEMEFLCSYRVLGGYLESLGREFPSALTVDGADIRLEGAKAGLLRVTLHVTTYLFEKSLPQTPPQEEMIPWQ